MHYIEPIIRKKASELKITIGELEQLAGISKNHIYAIFKKNDTSLSTLRNIATVLNIKMVDFFTDQISPEEKQSECEKELLSAYRDLNSTRRELEKYKNIVLNEGPAKYRQSRPK